MKILIADTLPTILDNVRKVLSSLPVKAQVDEAYDGADALRRVDSGNYDVAILGDNIPGMSGLDILEQAKANDRPTRILIYTDQPEGQSARRAFKLGASGYLSSLSAFSVLNLALYDIALGDGYEAHAS